MSTLPTDATTINTNIYIYLYIYIYSIICIIKKVFHYEETELPVIKCKDNISFRGKTIAEILKYANQSKAIHDHVDFEDRARFDELHGGTNHSSSLRASGSRGSITNNEKNIIYINESELYSLILLSKLESARVFK